MKNTDEKYRTILEHIGDGFITYDAKGNYTYVNKKAGELLGMKPEDLIGKNIWTVFSKEQYADFHKTYEASMREQRSFFTEEYYPPKDSWYESHFYPSPNDMTVFFRDITERKKHVVSILNEKNLSDTIINELPGLFYMSERDSRKLLRWNKNLETISGYTAEEIKNMITPDFVLPSQHEFANERREIAISEGKVGAELCLITKDKTKLDYYFKVMPIESNGQRCMLGIGIDITDQKRTERSLMQRNYDINERIKELTCLHKLSEITADSRNSMEDIIRKCVDLIPPAWQFPEVTCARIRFNEHSYSSDNFKETSWFQQEEIIADKLPAGKIEVFYTKQMPEAQEGPFLTEERFLINSIAKMLGNSADRKSAEETLQKSNDDIRELNAHLQIVREDERSRIAREIHDELGQQLTGLKMHLALVTKRVLSGDLTIQEDVKDINSLIDGTVKTVKRIASELRPGILDDLGLMAAMEWQSREFEKHTGVKCNFSCPPGDTLIQQEVATTVFRIYQESLTNVMRYANASLVESSLENTASEIKLVVKDNGVGFELDQIVDKKTLGLLGMQERAYAFGGKLRIDSKIGRGTTILLSIPTIIHNQNNKS